MEQKLIEVFIDFFTDILVEDLLPELINFEDIPYDILAGNEGNIEDFVFDQVSEWF